HARGLAHGVQPGAGGGSGPRDPAGLRVHERVLPAAAHRRPLRPAGRGHRRCPPRPAGACGDLRFGRPLALPGHVQRGLDRPAAGPLDPRAAAAQRPGRARASLHLRLRRHALRDRGGAGLDQRGRGDEPAREGGGLRAGPLRPDRVRLRLLARSLAVLPLPRGEGRVRGPSRWLTAGVLVLSLAPIAAPAADLPLDVRFDGRPLESTAPPDFTCFSATANRWVNCGVKRGEGPGGWVVQGLVPGRYRLHVSVDENPANPRRFPGDYEAQHRFEVTERGPERLTVDVVRLIHLTRPGDNARALEGMLTSCATQPTFRTPRLAWDPRARVEFAWEPIVEGAEYRVSVTAASCSQPDRQREVLHTTRTTTEVTVTLPPSVGDEQYYFWIAAWRDGRLVGDLYTHDGGVHSWNYRFQVRNASLPRWVYVGAAGLLLLLVLAAVRFLPTAEPARRRRLARQAVV